MVTSSLENYEQYIANDRIRQAFKFLKNTNLLDLEVGKHIIDGDKIFALVQNYSTKDQNLCKYESHKRYIDIQYIVSGKEKISYTNIKNLKLKNEDKENDKILYEDTLGNEFIINEGEFVVFYPEDGHKACIKVNKEESVKKIVLKVLN